MGLIDRAARVLKAELPGLEEDLAHGAKKLGKALDDWLTAAETRTFNDVQAPDKYYQQPPAYTPRAAAEARAQPFSRFSDFARVFEAGGIEPKQTLKLLGRAEERGFTPQLKTWLHESKRNKSAVLEPLTELLADRSQNATVQDEIFYRAHKLGLQKDTLAWLQTRPDLTESVGMSYRNFNAQMKKVPDRLQLQEPIHLTEDDFAFGRQFAKEISNALQARS